ncbi:MAG: type III-A CRISPR-associated RAMP protein Csm5 [Methanothrix sp.]|nr:type III-A CRISPR-associated RAMP protein Csm5 [Methanothrix sp.]MCX8207799.1 type III-A CRISPR-associated RAMP protein Csm5 [Methanothrix sp.]
MRYRLHVITPVHVGNGIRLGKMDCIHKNGKLFVVDMQKLTSLPGIDPDELSDQLYYSEFDIGNFLNEMNIPPARVMAYSVDCRCEPHGYVLSCIKDGTGMAYIPGSSIKGALRTAILWERIKSSPEKMERARAEIEAAVSRARSSNARAEAARELEKLFLGRDPNHDHLRALRVSDSGPIPTSSLEVIKVELLSLTGEKLLEKKMDKKLLEKKMDIFIEAIKPGTQSWVNIDLDEFLHRNASKLDMDTHDLREKELERITRSYCSEYVESEKNFFSKYTNPETEPVRDFYNRIMQLPERRGGMVLRIGWGGGWHGMTVARLFPELIDDLRRAFNLGKRNVPEFPKTRRLAMLESRLQPMGWVWLKPA